ncbi:MAG TPA: hypothetical protein VGC30_13400 [Dokdonella sp.]
MTLFSRRRLAIGSPALFVASRQPLIAVGDAKFRDRAGVAHVVQHPQHRMRGLLVPPFALARVDQQVEPARAVRRAVDGFDADLEGLAAAQLADDAVTDARLDGGNHAPLPGTGIDRIQRVARGRARRSNRAAESGSTAGRADGRRSASDLVIEKSLVIAGGRGKTRSYAEFVHSM